MRLVTVTVRRRHLVGDRRREIQDAVMKALSEGLSGAVAKALQCGMEDVEDFFPDPSPYDSMRRALRIDVVVEGIDPGPTRDLDRWANRIIDEIKSDLGCLSARIHICCGGYSAVAEYVPADRPQPA